MVGEPKGDAQENKTERVQLLMAPSEVEAIDDWSFAHRVRTRAAAIRRLIVNGLNFEAVEKVADKGSAIVMKLSNNEPVSGEEIQEFLGLIIERQDETKRTTDVMKKAIIYMWAHREYEQDKSEPFEEVLKRSERKLARRLRDTKKSAV